MEVVKVKAQVDLVYRFVTIVGKQVVDMYSSFHNFFPLNMKESWVSLY